jgi:putative transposase
VDEKYFRIKLPKMGWGRYHNSSPFIGEPKNITAGIEADGLYVSIQTEVYIPGPVPVSEPMVGIDLGVVRFATLSNGEVIEPLNCFRR